MPAPSETVTGDGGMGVQEFLFAILGLIAAGGFSWAVSIDCSHPTAASLAYWVSFVLFATLGPIWSWRASTQKMWVRAGAAAGTVFIAAIALVGAFVVRPACGQSQAPTNCSNMSGTNNCGNIYNLNRAPANVEIIGGPNGGTTAEIQSNGSPGAPSVGMDLMTVVPPGQSGVGLRVIQTGPGTGLRVIQNGPGVGLRSTVIVGSPPN
jgi:hypothetical protein